MESAARGTTGCLVHEWFCASASPETSYRYRDWRRQDRKEVTNRVVSWPGATRIGLL